MAPVELTETFPLSHATDAARIDRLERIARLMDSAVRIPGTRWRIGLDTIIGLVPGVGDTLALAPAAYIIASAWSMGLPKRTLARMAGRTTLDYAVGIVPLVGDLFDAGYKSNLRNVARIRDHLESIQ